MKNRNLEKEVNRNLEKEVNRMRSDIDSLYDDLILEIEELEGRIIDLSEELDEANKMIEKFENAE